ncbi:MAG TPA: Tat pathway signal protein [Gammaproteobacteria bacterium]|nr:Tat pathway signal protein [Gammaproteobacteria bacterium]
MNYSAAVRSTWHHYDLNRDGPDYKTLVQYATLAASSHNTQPWRFKLEPDRIVILPDLSRRCPAVDPDDHHLYASLGCAAENLLLAAQAAGMEGQYSYDASTSSLQVDLETASLRASPLFDAIPLRQCCRAEYDGTSLSAEQLRLLEDAGRGDGVSVILLTDSKCKAQVADYVVAGNTAQFADSAWSDELKAWIRFNAKDAIHRCDGLYGPVMGNPDVPAWLGLLYMRLAFSAKNQNRKDVRHIRSSAAVAVLYSETNDKPHWIEAGRCYERLALQAAALGLSTAFINQPVEVSALRPQFASFLGIGSRRPDLVVRIGRGPSMPRSLRRPVAEVIT